MNTTFRAEDLFNQGVSALSANNPKSALELLERALQLAPNKPSILENIAAALLNLNRFEEAKRYLDRVLEGDPKRPMALLNRAGISTHHDRFDEALVDLSAVLHVIPSCHEAWNGIGIAHEMKGDFDAARLAFKQAIKVKRDFAEAHQNLALLDLAQQRFADGWWRYEWRWDNPKYLVGRKFAEQPGYWDKTSPLLVWGEHGVGDQILYGTYLPALLELSDVDVYLLVSTKLSPLFSRAFKNTRLKVISEEEVCGLVGRDVWNLPMASIPHFLHVHFDRDPAPPGAAYLKKLLGLRQSQVSSDLRIGISWKSQNGLFGVRKSADLAAMIEPFFKVGQGVKCLNLQYGDVYEDLEPLSEKAMQIFDPTTTVDKLNDLMGLVSLMSCCHAVVTTSNTTAHLAGACGLPTYVLLPNGMARFWYWHRGRTDSPWYERVTLVEAGQGGWLAAVESCRDLIIKSLEGTH